MIQHIRSLARTIGGLSGWRRNLLAFVLGICMTLTLAPFYAFPLLLPSFTGLFWLINGTPSRKRMFWDGWWWGWGFHMTGLYWFCIALLTDPEKFAWLIPFTLLGLNAVIAIYCGIACWLMSWVLVRGFTRMFIFAAIWTCVEYARGHLFSGFPWNLAGYSFGFSDQSLQLASLFGVYGLTWFAVMLGTSPVALGVKKWGAIYVAVLWGIFLIGICWGDGRLYQSAQLPDDHRYVDGVMLRLVQANISQPNKWEPDLQIKGMKQHMDMTQLPGIEKVTHIIWPETAIPYAVLPDSPLTHMLGESIPEGKFLISGSLRARGEKETLQLWNSLMMFNHAGDILGSYDKIHLVPFGEFLPFRSLFPKEWLTPVGDLDFSQGTHEHGLTWPGLPPMIPLICYEVIFPEMAQTVNDSDDPRPQMLLSVTNDAWFGMSTGPYQHFNMARMRAVEQGVPMVRAANTGISAVVDSYGRVLNSLPLGAQGILDARLPVAQLIPTTYSKYSNVFMLLLIFFMLLLTARQQKTQK